jgi:CheY-like chemotaxis protein
MLLGELLEGFGHKICAIASTEIDAVAAAAEFTPDLLIVDANLRQGSGISAVRQITKACQVPHIFVTGDPRLVVAAIPEAIIIGKPYNLQTLVRAMADLDGPNHQSFTNTPERMPSDSIFE